MDSISILFVIAVGVCGALLETWWQNRKGRRVEVERELIDLRTDNGRLWTELQTLHQRISWIRREDYLSTANRRDEVSTEQAEVAQ